MKFKILVALEEFRQSVAQAEACRIQLEDMEGNYYEALGALKYFHRALAESHLAGDGNDNLSVNISSKARQTHMNTRPSYSSGLSAY